eukprot:TRINITY_DN8685_c0_g1_i1.p1 TRINITY_DN8685_c0_g1~~TRINITY_DN8685_c0_g1_i1.p1  ORF type:complete len:343 (-),score=51.37 TRINITY_DN8685_c0_g1_i1:307-1335(-)
MWTTVPIGKGNMNTDNDDTDAGENNTGADKDKAEADKVVTGANTAVSSSSIAESNTNKESASQKNPAPLPSLRQHVLQFWRHNKAKFHTYKCIQRAGFLVPRFPSHPFCDEFLFAMKESPGKAKVLETGCCYGTDVRFLLSKGIAPASIFATDLHSGYYDLGKELFLTANPSPANQHNEEQLARVQTKFGDLTAANDVAVTADAALADLAAADGDVASTFRVKEWGFESCFNFVSAFAVLHVFSADQTIHYLRRILQMLKAGGVLFGWCVGCNMPIDWGLTPQGDKTRFLHSKLSLHDTMKGIGFQEVDIEFVEHFGGKAALEGKAGDGKSDKGYLIFTAKK